MNQEVLRLIYITDKDGHERLTCVLDFYDHKEIYDDGVYRDFRGYVGFIRSERVMDKGDYTVVQWCNDDAVGGRRIFHEMAKGQRKSTALDKKIIARFMEWLIDCDVPTLGVLA